jgi:type I restriction enzyme, S subunit
MNVKDGALNFRTDRYTSEDEFRAFRKRLPLAVDDVLLTIVGTIGRAAVVDQIQPLVFQRSVAVIRPKTGILHSRFLYHLIQGRSFQSQLDRAANKSSQAGVYLGKLNEVLISLPSLSEQRRIATILDQAETLRTQRHAALVQLDSLTQSVFVDMFGDCATDSCQWEVAELWEVVRPGTIVTYGIVQAGEEFPGGVPYIRTGDIVNGSIAVGGLRHTDPVLAARFSRSRVEAGEIVMSIRATVGTTAIVPEDLDGANLTQGTARIAPGPATDAQFLLHFLRLPVSQHWISQQIKGATFREITLTRLRELPVAVPPLDLQKTFSERCNTIESLKATHRAALTELDALFASLQHRAFSGELTAPDLPVTAPSRSKVRMIDDLRKLDAEIGLEALIYVAKRTPKHDFYKALKSLYFADKHHLEHHGCLIYGETHCALPMGPVPQAAFDAAKVLSGEMLISVFSMDALHAALRRTDKQLIPLRDADFGKLGAAERESLDWAIRYCAPMSFDQVKTASHDTAYERTPANSPIAMEDMVRMLPEAAQLRFFGSALP